MNDLQFALLLLGSLAIGGVLAHGFWSLRRHKKPKIGQSYSYRKKTQVKMKTAAVDAAQTSKPEDTVVDDVMDDVAIKDIQAEQSTLIEPKTEPEIDLFECEPYAPLNMDDTPSFDTQTALDKNAAQEAEKVEDDGLSSPIQIKEVSDILVLHVKAPAKKMLLGSELLASLLDLGLKYGDMGIFHRHLSPSGAGHVMFSVANMAAPGFFAMDKLSEQKLYGVSFFMKLPCEQALMKFSLMLNTASQLADDLNAQLLDEQHQPWTSQQKKEYLQRIKVLTQVDADIMV
tara:strand:- start:555 stop:1415 length:861 start_codon:yes stop_codon:yes gene_type:complete